MSCNQLTSRVQEVAMEVSKTRKQLRERGKWDLLARLRWLRNLDAALVEKKNFILITVAQEKSVSEHNVLLNEYIPTRLLIREYIKSARRVLRDQNRSRSGSLNFGNKRVIIRNSPLGVVGVISPFNYPFSLPLGVIIPALLGGNAVILKPSEQTPNTNLLVHTLLAETLSQCGATEIFSMLPSAVEYGRALVAEPCVNKIHFTGSVAAGRAIAKANAEVRFTPPTLELGGSNAAIVLSDADLDSAARTILWARFCGQSCNAVKRVFAVDAVYDALYERLDALLRVLRDEERVTKFSKAEENHYRAFVNDYLARNPNRDAHDAMSAVIPALFRVDQYDPNLLMLKEETFVPILPVVRVSDVKEAIRCANDSQFGLGASVFTCDKKLFRLVANELEAGGIYHNDALTEAAQAQVPFGGIKNSGWGSTHGPEGLLDFVRPEPVIEERYAVPAFLKLHLYPWTEKNIRSLRRWVNVLIRFS